MAKDDIVEAEEGPKSDAFMTGLVVFTTIALVAAWFIIKHANDSLYG